MTHARTEVLPSLGAATQVLKTCRDIAQHKAATFTGTDAGIVWLGFQLAVLEEALLLVDARRERNELGATHDDEDAAGTDTESANAGNAVAVALAEDGSAGVHLPRTGSEGSRRHRSASTLPQPKYLAPPIHLAPIDNPLAIVDILENTIVNFPQMLISVPI